MGALILGVLLAMAGPVQPVQAACGGTTPVSDETELNNAIAAFNAETTTPCVFTIQLSTDIPLTASTTRIDNATSGVSLAIEGGGFAVDGQGTAGVRPFEIGADTAVTMNNLTVTGGNMTGTSVNDPGGGIYSAGTLTLSNSTIFSNSTMASGGGLYVASGSVSLPGTKIISNTTAVRGGGVYLDNSGTLNGGLIQGNSSFGFGGGIYAVQTLTLTGTQILSNTSTSNGGGGLFLNDGGTLNGALIQGNSTTTRFGGGIHFRGTLLTLNDTQVISNTAATNGGGLYTDVDTELIGGLVQGNSATQNGGGIHADGMLTLNGTQVISNTATNGGGLYFNNNATLNGGLVQGNSATQDGGGVESVQQLTLTGTQILSNTATNSGGGLYIINGGTLNGGLVQGNSADKGGGIHFRGTLVALNGTQILTNTAASSGGGLYTSDSAAELIGGLVQGNQTGTRGGGGIFAGNDFSISDTQVIGNSGPYGGGVMSDDGTLRISGGLVQGNSADNGGGLYVWENALITNTQFLSNTATSGDGGGLLFESSGTITGGIVSHNTASRYGGGLARDSFSNSPSNLMLSGTQILNNSAGNAGGGLYLESGTIENSLVQGNQTNQPGGGIYATKGLTLTNSQLLNNPGQQGNGIWVIEQLTVQQTVTTTNDLVVQGNWQQDGVFKQLGGVVKLNGSAAQTIAGTQPIAFTNLEISNASAAGVSLGSDITVTNQLNLVNDLTTTPAYRVNLTSGATTAGAGDVWGNTYRAHNFTDATAYAYGNPNVAITFGAGSVTPSAMLVQLDKGLPAGFPTAVSRAYTVTPTGGGAYLATLRLRYLDTELNGNSEAALDLFRYNGSSWVEHGQSAADTSANWLEQSGLSTFSPWAIGAGVCTTANSWTVSNESELNTAIGCFNGKLVAGSYPITLTQNISLTASTPVINNATSGIDLVINGGGFAVDGQGTSGVRVFDIAASTTVTMNEITVRGGNTSSGQDGGGIENRGNLTLNDSTLVNNKSGRDGSAISNYGILTVTGSTFSGNQAGTAAGVASGGALRNHSTGQLTVSNSTFTGNFGGNHEVDLYNNGTAILDSVTMASFYGFFGHSTTFRNSILLECGLLGINPVDGGHNLVQTPGVCSSFTAPTTLVGVAPLLGPLADNGGETETHALLDGSPAIDTGATTLTTDQRGEARPFGLADDIGAYELRANGTIVITKQTAPANAGDFDFTHNITTTTTFTLTGGQSETFLDVAPGTYTVTEGVEAGWRLVNLRCDDTASAFPSTGDTATRAATINLEPGETVTCTFSNSEDDIIFVQKETVPAGGTGFDFTLGGDASATFTLNDGGIQGISVVSGTYTLTETDPGPDYNLTDIECTVFGPGPTDETDVFGNLATGSVDLTLTSGQAVFCLFTNEKSSGTLTIVKDANPADGTDFDFELGGNATNTFTLDDAVPDDNDGITNTISYTLPVGSYVLTETVPAGWFTGPIISCRGSSSYSVGGNVLFVDVGPGADVVCTFGNRKLATLTVVKQTVGGDGAFDFGFYNVFGTQLDAFTLTTQSGTAQRVLSDLDTLERYEIEETVPAGWTLTNAQCSGVTNDNWVRDGNSLKPLLAPGDNATCTFTNQALACNANAWPVSNEVELNAAISCYNNKTVAGSYTITVTDDIDLTASTTIINNATSGVSLVIEGDGFVVDGQDTVGVRPFEIAADTTVTMNQLAVTGGNIPSDQGGGIYNGGTLTISSSTISDNSALTAGGIENRGTLTVFNSTISGNSTSGSPGGGGIVNGFGGVLTLDSVTISANSDTSATGAGGLWTSNTAATLRNSILAGNSGRDCGSTSGTPVTDGGHNLVGTQSNCGLTNGANGNIVGSDPLLGPLADNGGETETHALLGGSPAIDAGSTSLTTDQRGVTRPQFGVADIGAYESVCGTATGWTAATELELDTAIGCFNKQTVAGSYTITVTGNISLTSSIAAIDNPTSGPSLVIVGGNHTIDGGDAPGNPGAGGFIINSPTAVSITDLTVTRSRQLLTGGAIRNPNGGALTLNNVSLTHNQAGFGGGALSSTGPVTITNSLISHNYNPAGKGGGGILIESLGSLTLIDSEVSDNTTAVIGGGIYAESGANLTITRSTISGNSAARGGGGLANFGSLSVGASTLSDNSATGELGGGIYNADTGSLILTNSTLSGNNADLGGGIYNDGALDLDSVTIANNTVTIAGSINGGGALYAGGDVTMNNSILAGSTGSEDCYFTGLGSFVSGENNLIETQTTGDCGVGADIVNTDPKLGPLADNGGETDTHALLGGSPAINAGDTALTTDQRGVTRPQGAADDMGALEAEIGTITIIKDADPADDTPFDFTITGGISDTFTLRDPSAISTTFSALVGGKYEVTELLPAGWELAYIDCQHGPNSFVGINYGENRAYITLAPGDDVTCTFNNKLRLGSLTVVKNAVGGDGAFPFTSPSLGTFTVTTASGAGRQVFPNLLPGAYSFSESVPAGWRLDSAVCTDGSPVNAVQVDPGEDVTCTFTNTRLDTIVVVKRAVGGDGSFAFTSPQLGAFNLKTLKGEQQISFANLAPGSYSIAETAQPGWTPTVADPVCSNGDNASNITLAAGETVVCVFVNLKQDTLVVEKRTVGGDGSFNFASPQLGAFALNTTGGAASQSFTGLSNGVYNISETVSAGWVQSGASCSDGSSPASISLAPGASVSCVFTNTKLSSITVVKNATGGDGSFDFSSPQLGSFNLATTAGTAQQTFSGLAAGSYAISETVPAGWDLTGATCSDGSPVSAIDLAAGEDVTCRFANVNRGGLIVVKNTVGGDGQFAFTSQALGGFTVNTSGGSGQQAFPNLVPGTYDLAETIPAGWRLESATCSDGSSPASVTVDPGENVTCTFTNTKLDTIVIVKRAVGGDGVFTYTSQALGGFALTTANGEAQRSFDNLAPGVYDVSENATAGWTATVADPVCSNGDNASNITLAAGQTVVCVFVNLKQDTITVEKRTVGGDGSFVFASPQLGSFSLNTTGGAASQSFTGLSSGSYSISETLPAGWVQSGASCTGGVNPASISLAPGANVSCVFTNTKLSSITVVKNAAGGDGTFAFSSPQLGSFNLATAAGAAQQSFSGLAAGSYAISETVPGGWDLTSATCSDGSNPAAINLAAGENVTCTFANTRRGGLTVVKKTIGGDGSFAFTSAALGDFTLATSNGTAQRSFANLIPGSYDLLETAATGWDLTSATCSDGSNPASVDIGPGENVTCTFANTKRGSVTIVKNSVGGDGQFGFTSQRLGGFSLATANGTAAQSFANLVPGVYAVSETTQAGWDLTGATCSDGSSPASINLGAGENVTCTFVNQKRGSLTVVKNAVGGDGVFPFTSGSLGSFVLTTTNGAAQTSFSNILSGTYSISESVPAGWAQSAATCSDGSNPANIAIGSGEDVTCTFTNTKLDTIVVVKRAVGGDGSFAFNSPQLGAFNLKTVKGEQTANFSGLGAGSYSISETVPTGWTASVADPVCSNGDNASNITLAAGQTVVCVFVNLKQDTITVEKRTVGGDGSFVFASPQLGSFSLNTTGGSASRTFSGLSGGSYSISETLPAGWVQSGATCSDGSDLASISLVPGANVSCIFTNTQLSSITVVKNATGGDGSFDFSSPQLGSVVLTTTAGTAQQSFGGLAAGSYAISETVPAGWDLSGATCSDGSPIDAIALTPGENVTCTFANTKQGSLTVVKQTVGSDGAFNFTSTALGNFALTTANGAEQQSFANLRPGRYDVAEAIPAGWRLSGATCSDGSAPGSVDIGPGEAVTCTFANEKLDSITVIKRTVGGDGSFDFGATGSGLSNFSLNTAQGVASISFDNLVSGSYSISESVPAGWTADVADPVCSNGDNASAISLAAGESVVCEFVNRKKDSITIIKRSVGGDGSFNFTSSLGSFALTTSGGVTSTIFSNVVSGTYSISESVPAGWVLTSASCDNGDSPASISLGSGENVSCTFVNTKLGNITILKETAGGNGRFTFDGDLGSFSLKTADGLAKQSFGDLAAGRYRVSENSLTGWTQSSATCSDGSDPAAIDLAPGENVTCRFVNTKNGSLRVIKQTVGGDGSFAFASQTLGSFGLTSVGGTGQQSFANLLPGSYDLAETVPAGWDLTSAVCSDGSSPARIDIAPGEDVSCTFVNTKRGSISIVKQSVGGDGSFAFTSPALGNFSLSSVGGTAQQRFTNLLPGVYPIRETAQNGWDLRSAVCSDGSDPASINLGAGEDVTCTFVNTKRGSLTVVKEATGGDDSFAFVSPALGSFVITTTGGAGQASFANLQPGSYAISETVAGDWRLTSAQCDNGSPVDAIAIGAGEDVTCTFANLKDDTIVVIKRAVGGDGSFAFTGSQGLGSFSLSTVQGVAQQSFGGLAPGSYAISETVPAGWTAQDADPVCSNGQRASSLNLAAGESIVCEFVNLKQNSIVIQKRSLGGDGTFNFVSPQLGAFGLSTQSGVGSRAFTGLTPGQSYAISESVPAGWVQSGASCDNGSSPDNITLAAGATATCTFTNTRLSSVTILKQAIGGDARFAFSGGLGDFSVKTAGGLGKQTLRDLAAGSYTISETVASGWVQSSASCSDGSDPASLPLGVGENVTCTFVNTKLGSLSVVKQATGGDGSFAFVSQALGDFAIATTGGTGQQSFANLQPGSYDLAETIPAGWRLESAVCSDGSDPASIDIGPGENVTCTFANTKLDSITVVKRTVGGDASFDFTATGSGLSNFSLSTANGVAQQLFSGLGAGSYSIGETAAPGWHAQDVDPLCSNGDRASAITLAAGESVVCEFVNHKDDTITIVKRTVGGDASFDFTATGSGLSNFSLSTANGVAQQSFSGLAAGVYSISEQTPSGWDLTSAVCNNGDSPTNIVLGDGENVVCTFVNTKRGSITLVKNSTGGDGSFDFSVAGSGLSDFRLTTVGGTAQQRFDDLLAGTYAISETAQAGWELTSATCSDGSSLGAIHLEAGEDLTCTVENSALGSITVVKQATGGDGSFGFASQALGSFVISTTGGTGQVSFANLQPGSYDIRESGAPGWNLVSGNCDNGDSPATLILTVGEDVTCTFVNELPTATPVGPIYLPIIRNEPAPQPTILYLPLVMNLPGQIVPQVIYSSNFMQGIGPGWSAGAVTTTSPSGTTFLGGFGAGGAQLHLPGLSAHGKVRVELDLYIIRSWDGNQVDVPAAGRLHDLLEPTAIDGGIGPDRWMLKADGQTILDASFTNFPEFTQSYPAAFGSADNPAHTGSFAVNSLGYTFFGTPMDASYRISRTFDHTADTLNLNFEALGLQPSADESWGINNLSVVIE